MEEISGVKFHEAQVALARVWIGDVSEGIQKEVTIALPKATTDGLVVTDKSEKKKDDSIIKV